LVQFKPSRRRSWDYNTLRSLIPACGRWDVSIAAAPPAVLSDCASTVFVEGQTSRLSQPTFAGGLSCNLVAAPGENPPAIRTHLAMRRYCLELGLFQVFGDRSAHVKFRRRNLSFARRRITEMGCACVVHITSLRKLLPVPIRSWVCDDGRIRLRRQRQRFEMVGPFLPSSSSALQRIPALMPGWSGWRSESV
jgi:hypothetical protein